MRGPGWIQGVDGRETSGSGVAVPAARPLTNLLCVARAAGVRRQGDKEPGNEGLKGSESLLDIDDLNMIEFDPPDFRALFPYCPDGSHLPRWGLILPRLPSPTSVLYSAVTHPARGYVSTLNPPNPTQKHRDPFSWPELANGQNEVPPGQSGPQLGKMFEKTTTF